MRLGKYRIIKNEDLFLYVSRKRCYDKRVLPDCVKYSSEHFFLDDKAIVAFRILTTGYIISYYFAPV